MENNIDAFSNYIVKGFIVVVLLYLFVYMWLLLNSTMTILAIPVIILVSGILAILAGYYNISIQFHINTNDMNLDTSQDSATNEDKTYRFIPVTPQGPKPYKVSQLIANVLEPLEPITPPLDLKPEPNQQHED